MKKIQFALTLLAATAGLAHAQVVTEAVGFNTVTCLAGSDTRCSVPLTAETAFVGVVSSTSVPAAGQLTIVPTATAPGWTANQFATSYYAKLTSGSKAGMYYQILSNTTTDITVDLAGDTAGIAATDGVKICKFWTLATLFPPATQTTVIQSVNNLPNGRRTEILIPDMTSAGTNLSPNQIFFLTSTGWKKAVSGFPDASSFILVPDSFFIVRHGNAAITTSTTFTITGNVDLSANTTPLSTQVATKQDNPVTTGRPIPIALQDLDLVQTGAFTASLNTLPNGRRDEIYVYDNAVPGINKSPSAIYFYYNGHWKKAVSGFPDADTELINPSEGFLIRKYQSGSGNSVSWTQSF